jgi:hypothetical protein
VAAAGAGRCGWPLGWPLAIVRDWNSGSTWLQTPQSTGTMVYTRSTGQSVTIVFLQDNGVFGSGAEGRDCVFTGTALYTG